MPDFTRREFLKKSALLFGALLSGSFLAACAQKLTGQSPTPSLAGPKPTTSVSPADNVLGVGRGVFPGRVVWAHNPAATLWDGQSDFWWSAGFTDHELVSQMLSNSLRQLTGQSSDTAAWDALFTHFKTQRGRTGGYKPGEKIAIKANFNGAKGHAITANDSFVSPAVAVALLNQLVGAGVKPTSPAATAERSASAT